MATTYYPQLDAIQIGTDGSRVPVPSETFDVYNVTATASLGTVSSDANGVIPAGTFTATAGDVIELSHATYPEVLRLTLAESEASASIGNAASYVVENLQTGRTTAYKADIYIEDLDNPLSPPVYVGSGLAGETAVIPLQTSVPKNLRVKLVSILENEAVSKTDFSAIPYQDISIEPNAIFTGVDITTIVGGLKVPTSNPGGLGELLSFGSWDNSGMNTELYFDMDGGSHILRMGADLRVSGTANVSGTNTGDQTSIVGITGTKAQFNTAATDGDFVFGGDSPTLGGLSLTGRATIAAPDLDYIGLTMQSTTGTNAVGIRFTNTGNSFFGRDTSTSSHVVGSGRAYDTYLWAESNTALVFGTNNTARLTILNDGSVGIGTSSPATLLDVNGITTLRGEIRPVDGANVVLGSTTGTKIGTSGSQKLSFWGKTPTTQGGSGVESSFTGGGATSPVYTDSTFDGYTLMQIVRGLRDMGLFA